MSDVTEKEVREAAAMFQMCRDYFQRFGDDGSDEATRASNAATMASAVMSKWTIQELARRDAERSERELPIDAEWLESIGFQDGGAYFHMKYDGGKVFVSSDKKYVYVNASPIYAIKTRGQLIYLLAALKGGAT